MTFKNILSKQPNRPKYLKLKILWIFYPKNV